MELLFLYLKLIGGSLIGITVMLLVKNKSFLETAGSNNVEYSLQYFLRKDRLVIFWAFLGCSAVILIASGAIANSIKFTPNIPSPYLWGFLYLSIRDIVIAAWTTLFITVGYMGQDFLLRFLSRTSQELKEAIKYKAKQTDKENGTLDKPTPIK